MRLKLTIAYDGAAFKGWQSQPFGNTVQDVLEDALKRITGERVNVHASGRTDTGVHAIAQCAHLELTDRFDPAGWLRILNHNLPQTIRIMRCERAAKTFNAQRSARGKVYRYVIRNAGVLSPHEADRAWLVPDELHINALRTAAKLFVGTHDYRGFAGSKGLPKDTSRTISRLAVAKKGSLITLTFQGDGFLYHMVRMITASLVRVAQGTDTLDEIKQRLHGPGQPHFEEIAPAGGLYLVKVLY